MKKIIFLMLFAFPLLTLAQSDTEVEDQEGMEEAMPVFPKFEGGEVALIKYLADSLNYPAEALENKVEGIVFIMFEINEKGEVVNSQLLGEDLGSGLSQEAIRLVDGTSGMWEPGLIDGVPTTIKLRVPVKFEL